MNTGSSQTTIYTTEAIEMPDYNDNSTWMSYDDVPASSFTTGYNTGTMPQWMVDYQIAQNRGESRTATPSMGTRPGGSYGANPNPTMGIQQGGVGSIPGASSEYNQRMGASRAKNDAIGEYGGWGQWTGAGSPTDIFSGIPNVGSGNEGAPPAGYLQSDAFRNRPGQWQTQLPGTQGGDMGGQPQQRPGNQTLGYQNRGSNAQSALGNLPMGNQGSGGAQNDGGYAALTQALMGGNWGPNNGLGDTGGGTSWGGSGAGQYLGPPQQQGG
jgi:hypothetical protein